MNQLINHLNAGVVEQNREVALENCLKTWDDSLDLETILQGVMERYSAVGLKLYVEGGLRATRKGLNHVVLETPTAQLISVSVYQHLKSSPYGYCFQTEQGNVIVYVTEEVGVTVFHNHELETMARWLLENFHE